MFRRCVGRSRLDCIGPHGINVPRVWPALGSMPLGREEQSPTPSSNYSALLRFLRRRTRAYAPARARNDSPAPAIGPGAPFPFVFPSGVPTLMEVVEVAKQALRSRCSTAPLLLRQELFAKSAGVSDPSLKFSP